MAERLKNPTLPHVIGRIDGLNGQQGPFDLVFIDKKGQIVKHGDERLDGYTVFGQEDRLAEDSNVTFLRSGNINGTLIIQRLRRKFVLVYDGDEEHHAFELGSHVDIWFKTPLKRGRYKTGEKIMDDQVTIDLSNPKYKRNTRYLRVVALFPNQA